MNKLNQEKLDDLISQYIASRDNNPFVFDVRFLKKKIHHDFLEDLIRHLDTLGFNAYYSSGEKTIVAFPIDIGLMMESFNFVNKIE